MQEPYQSAHVSNTHVINILNTILSIQIISSSAKTPSQKSSANPQYNKYYKSCFSQLIKSSSQIINQIWRIGTMVLLKFLLILEKISIAVIVLCFVPIIIYAFNPQPIQANQQIESAVEQVKSLIKLVGFLTDEVASNTCENNQILALSNEKCLNRCSLGSNCFVLNGGRSCVLQYSYKISGQYVICSSRKVLNEQVQAVDTPTFEQNTLLLPLALINMDEGSKLITKRYCILDRKICKQQLQHFKVTVEQSYHDNYELFSTIITYLMYFGLIPLIFHIVVVFFIDICCKHNLRLTNSLMIIHAALLGIAVIVAGIQFNTKNDFIGNTLKIIASQCLIDNKDCNNIRNPIAKFQGDDNISDGFVTGMNFVLAILVIFVIGIIVINILIIRFNKLRRTDTSAQGYQLQLL